MIKSDDIVIGNYTIPPDGTITPGIVIPGQQLLSGFNVKSDRTLGYTVSGKSVTALTGTLLVGGVARTLTHVSSGVASISGSPVESTDTPLSVTIGSTTPALTAPVAGINVINNVPALPPLAKQTLTFSAPGTQTGDTFALVAADKGFRTVQTINTANRFEVIYKTPTEEAIILGLSPAAITDFNWFASPVVTAAVYRNNNQTSVKPGTDITGAVPAGTFYKLAKSGNNIILSRSPDNTTYTAIKTFTDALIGVPTLYINVFNAAAVITNTGQIQLYA
jgi:hypothetical protein